MTSLFFLIQLFYWLSLSTWFGGVIFVAVAAPIVFRTVRESDPTLPTVLSVNLESEHSTLLAGNIVGNLLAALVRIELACAGVLLLAIGAQWAVFRANHWDVSTIRTCLFVAAAGVAIYDWRMVAPAALKYRQEYIDHADEPELANAARERFDHYNKESVTLLAIEALLLSGLILFSANISTAISIHIAAQ